MRKLLFSLFCMVCLGNAWGQSVTGAWYGKADVNSGSGASNYLIELVLKQKGDEVEGIFAYYFKDSHQSFFVRGTYDKAEREVHIKNLPVLHYRGDARNGIECPMNFVGTLLVSQVKSTLNGYFYSDDKYKYTCPELRVVLAVDGNMPADQAMAAASVGRKFWTPQEEDAVVVVPVVEEKKVDPAPEKPAPNTEKEKKAREKLIESFAKRTSIYSKDLEVEGDSVRISFYDNGDIDGDTISVFINKQPALSRQSLSARALNVYVKFENGQDLNEVSMYAENLGKYPPNTALMVVSDGKNRYEVYLSSSLTQNAVVRLKKKRKVE